MGSAADRIDNLRATRIPDNPDISAADQDALLTFSEELYLRKADYSDHHVESDAYLFPSNRGGRITERTFRNIMSGVRSGLDCIRRPSMSRT